MKYDRPPVRAPRLSGLALKAFVSALESGAGGLIAAKLMDDSGLGIFRKTTPGGASPSQAPLPCPERSQTQRHRPAARAERATAASPVERGDKLETVAEFRRA